MSAALFWDIDGTLLTTGRAGMFAFEEAVEEVCGVPADLGQLVTSGLTDAEVATLILNTVGQEATPERADALLHAYETRLPASLPRRQGRVLPGVREVLEDLEARTGVHSYLLTGNTPAGARAKLAHYSLDRFFPDGSGAFCIDHESRTDIARRALRLVEGDTRLFVIGDTPADIACGKAIGAETVAVATGWHSLDELAACEPALLLEEIPDPTRFRELLDLRDG